MVVLFFSALFIGGCATPVRENQSVDSKLHQQRLSAISQWQVKGRLAFKSTEEKVSAYMRWRQKNKEFDLTLTTFIGTTIMTMQNQPGFAQLEADEQIYTDIDASSLILQVTGWNIPVDKLALWIKGQYTRSDNVVFDDNGLLSSLTAKCRACAPWTLQYSRYKQVGDVWLPHDIVLTNSGDPNNQIKIKISAWQLT
ncbi:lipoprotein insertase outer membrane protein LolB [Aliiglaciecola litoralis]|uniref:Outer-membrane lipoprotein LolB n=1 Tax=Aliiglaciecola litoralis TaxID=582857 RepID=A0ABP3WY71_9ALTE